MENFCYPFVNTPLPYSYNALSPYIDEKTMMLHHDRHLKGYIDNLNKLLKECKQLQKLSLRELICCNNLPGEISEKIKNNAGGIYAHRMYFALLQNPSKEVHGMLLNALIRDFGSFEDFKSCLKEKALSVFGSGWVWLMCKGGKTFIVTTKNQGVPICSGCYPIIPLDCWEHAYYLKHYNDRGAYIDDFLKIINWSKAEMLYQRCCRQKRTYR
ncbi:MAG: superoxide dismutase [Acutalibacteraceae bacterium]